MHPEVQDDKPGNCPKCGMNLVRRGDENKHTAHKNNRIDSFKELFPLFVIIFGVIVFTFIVSMVLGLDQWNKQMQIFMGGFFLTFSGFKLLDVKGFADAYQTYDLLAKRSRLYAFSYPFIELLLGFCLLFSFQIRIVSLITFLIMGISAIGVFGALKSNRKFQCACLGAKLKLPMTKITLTEDLLMSAMGLVMFLI